MTFIDFLTFKSFISLDVLIVFYYLGALVLPIAMWAFSVWLIKKYKLFNITYEKGKDFIWQSLNMKQKSMLTLFLTTMFAFMELFWRMMFEFLIAYMQMRDALLQVC